MEDEKRCGRPLGVKWRNGKLYILDAYHGLFELVFAKRGARAKHLVRGALMFVCHRAYGVQVFDASTNASGWELGGGDPPALPLASSFLCFPRPSSSHDGFLFLFLSLSSSDRDVRLFTRRIAGRVLFYFGLVGPSVPDRDPPLLPASNYLPVPATFTRPQCSILPPPPPPPRSPFFSNATPKRSTL